MRVRGAQLGQVTCPPPSRQLRVGRAQDSELWLADDGVSRRHAPIERQRFAEVLPLLGSGKAITQRCTGPSSLVEADRINGVTTV